MLGIKSVFQQNKTLVVLALSSMLFYTSFAYYLVRTDFTKLIMLYGALFFLFYKLVQLNKNSFKYLSALAFAFRVIFLFAVPNLSQDFYRFIWDGRMILEGINPYLFTPEFFISNLKFPVPQAQELYNGMGIFNGSHFTNYPPINQLCFVIAGLFAGKSILGSAIILRLLIIAADFGTLYFGKKLLEKLKLPIHNIFWYILNPFIIIELTGNLHFEAVMIFFLVWSLYLLHSGNWKWSAVVLALSISVKLIPLIFLPLFYQWFSSTSLSNNNSINSMTIKKNENQKNINVIANQVKHSVSRDEICTVRTSGNDPKSKASLAGITKLILFYGIVGITTLLLFAPFYASGFVINFMNTVGLWFDNFEFNASLYYLARELGYLFRGLNEIANIGKIMGILVFIFVLITTFFRKNKTPIELITAMLLVLSFYYFTTTTVHPWYLATLLILSIFTTYRFPLVWSFVVVLSYLAYVDSSNEENLWIISVEYIIVYGVFIWEMFLKSRFGNKQIIPLI